MTQIRLQGVTKIYESGKGLLRAVDDVSIEIASGELFFLLGPSGCGKTTLLRIIAGLIPPGAGRVFFGERDVTDLPPERRNAAMVFQSYALWPHMTVAQNVEFGPKMRGLPRRRRRNVVAEALASVQMQDFSRRRPTQLSGGQQQRVAVARALAAGAECLLFDEPLSNLDARLRMHMRGELWRLVKSAGSTAVYVTHDQKEALSMADRVAVMNEGAIVQVGTPEEIYNCPVTRFVADFVGEANFIDGMVVGTGQRVLIDTPVGQLQAETKDAPRLGSAITCCIRPERIRITPAPGSVGFGAWSILRAAVISETYLGEMRQLACRLTNGDIWKASTMGARETAPRPGGQATLVIDAADVILVPHGGKG
ncbi:MAG TPA: ABC transporter ATP-binding protein [Phycisphaerae bacterium]|nr:ABC transporter ATP-binding protein [Phycisphaerae bacterium]